MQNTFCKHLRRVVLMVWRNVIFHPEETRVIRSEIRRRQLKRTSLKVVTMAQKQLHTSIVASLKRVRFWTLVAGQYLAKVLESIPAGNQTITMDLAKTLIKKGLITRNKAKPVPTKGQNDIFHKTKRMKAVIQLHRKKSAFADLAQWIISRYILSSFILF